MADKAASPSDKGYKEGDWGEETNYECDSCAYSTLNEDQMIAHVAAGNHPAKGGH